MRKQAQNPPAMIEMAKNMVLKHIVGKMNNSLSLTSLERCTWEESAKDALLKVR